MRSATPSQRCQPQAGSGERPRSQDGGVGKHADGASAVHVKEFAERDLVVTVLVLKRQGEGAHGESDTTGGAVRRRRGERGGRGGVAQLALTRNSLILVSSSSLPKRRKRISEHSSTSIVPERSCPRERARCRVCAEYVPRTCRVCTAHAPRWIRAGTPGLWLVAGPVAELVVWQTWPLAQNALWAHFVVHHELDHVEELSRLPPRLVVPHAIKPERCITPCITWLPPRRVAPHAAKLARG